MRIGCNLDNAFGNYIKGVSVYSFHLLLLSQDQNETAVILCQTINRDPSLYTNRINSLKNYLFLSI